VPMRCRRSRRVAPKALTVLCPAPGLAHNIPRCRALCS
jgi:hypothetical protein